MEVQILQETLSKNLLIATRFVSFKSQLPVLGNILLSAKDNKLLIVATNLESSICLSVGARVIKEGEITVPAKVITDLISHLKPGQVNIKVEKEKLSISSQGFNSEVVGMNANDFPSVPQILKGKPVVFPKEKFISSLDQVLFSVSTDETRPVLTGVLFIFRKGEIVLVSTDGFRLTQKRIKTDGFEFEEEKRLIIPKSTLSEILRLAGEEEVSLSLDEKENQVVFGISDSVLASRIIEGDFPDFERIIPKDSKIKVNLDKEEFLRAVRLASVFARDAANVVKLHISQGEVKILAESSQSGRQETKLDAKVELGEEKDSFLIAYNYRFLEEFLDAIEGDEVRMEFSDANSPGLFLDTKDQNFLHIIMPVRLQE